MEFTHLVVNGCSWTYGQGLDNPKTQSWAGLLAKKLDCPIVNLAVPGSGNESITRRTYEYVYENKYRYDNKPLFVILFSQIWRKEVWMQDYYGSPANDYCTMFPATVESRNGNPQEVAWLHEFNEEDFLRKDMLVKSSLKNLFNSLGYPYLIGTWMDDDVKSNVREIIKNRFTGWFEEYENKNDFMNLSSHMLGQDLTTCSHPGPIDQKIIFAELYKILVKKYPNIKNIPSSFLKLSDYEFNKKDNSMSLTRTDWVSE